MRKFICLTVFYLFAMIGNSFAVGLDITEVGLRANAMGTAYTGVADDASAVFWNPAGLTQIENDNISGEIEMQFLYPTFLYQDAAGKDRDYSKAIAFPTGFIAYKFGDFAIGTGLYVPYATGTTEYKDVLYAMGSLGGTAEIKASSAFFAIGGSIAYQVMPALSIGVTGEAIYGVNDIETTLTTPIGTVTNNMHYRGWAGARYSLGAMLKPVESFNIGLQVKSKTDLRLEGTSYLNDSTNNPLNPGNGAILGAPTGASVYDDSAEYNAQLPWEFLGGIAYKVSPTLLISVDGAYKMWGGADKKTIKADPLPDQDVTAKEKSNYTIAFGLEDIVTSNLKIRGGMFYISPCANDNNISYLNVLDTAVVSARGGISYNILPKLELCADLGYAYSDGALKASNDTLGDFGANTWTAVVGLRYSK